MAFLPSGFDVPSTMSVVDCEAIRSTREEICVLAYDPTASRAYKGDAKKCRKREIEKFSWIPQMVHPDELPLMVQLDYQ